MNIQLRPAAFQKPAWFERVSDWLIRYCLPIGWLALLTGMFWIGDRSRYHKLYYAFLFFPTILALGFYPYRLKRLLSCPLILLFIAFAAYTMASISWSGSGENPLSIHSLYILCLLLAAALMEIEVPLRLEKATAAAALIAALSAALSVAYFLHSADGSRLPGYGALYNPLLSAHVFGAFCAYWLARWWLDQDAWVAVPIVAILILWGAIAFTGSRTPLVALFACLVWLAMLSWKRRFFAVVILAIALILLAQLYFQIDGLIGRGMSYRPAIWAEALNQIKERPLFGHGYTHPMVFHVDGLGDTCCADPHNLELAVFYSGGIVGLLLWLSMYAFAFVFSWRNRADPAVLLASTLVVFGFVSGLTEGNAFFARPKEHWFLLWIPFALFVAAWFGNRRQMESGNGPTETI
jgi:O-antigen ligase